MPQQCENLMNTQLKLHFLLLLAALSALDLARAQGTAFNYQGRLTENGVPSDGVYDFSFSVYDAEVGGNALAAPVPVDAFPVVTGQFTVPLDFGAGVFSGAARWLEISVRLTGAGAYTILAPRQA